MKFTTIAVQNKELAEALPMYTATVKAIDSILFMTPAEEALNSNCFGRFLVAIADTFVGILSSVATSFAHFNRPLKRSELREFIASNKLKVATVDGLPADKVRALKMDVPAHMNTTFKQAITTVAEIHATLDALNRSKRSRDAVIEIFKALTDNNADVNKAIDAFAADAGAIMAKVKPLVLKSQHEFNDKLTVKKPYSVVYNTPAEFIQCKQMLLDIENNLIEVHEMRENIKTIEQQLRGIAKVVESGDNKIVTSASLTKFGNALKSMALVFDSVQLAATRQLALEHNTILNYNTIYDKAR